MKNLLVFAFALFLTTGSTCAQHSVTGSKNYVTKQVAVGEFSNIRVTGSPDVIYTQTSGKPHVEIYGSDNIVDLLDVYVEKNALIIKFKPNISIRNTGKLEVRVSAPVPDMFEVTGSGEIFLANGVDINKPVGLKVTGSGDIYGNEVRCPKLNMRVTGSGDVKLTKVVAEDLSAEVSGSGDIEVKTVSSRNVKASVSGSGDLVMKGKSVNADFKVSGSGDMDTSGLEAANVIARVGGSGEIQCHATSSLNAHVGGSGSIRYKGNPSQVETSKKGVRRL